MSYARHNGDDSEVYVIRSISGYLECLGCRITGEPSSNGLRYGYYVVEDEQDMIDHLLKHRAQGWKVPEHALERLRSELVE